MKENVIIGKLIPVGTGMKRYRSTHLSTDDVMDISFDEEFVEEDTEETVNTEATETAETADVAEEAAVEVSAEE